MRRTLRFACTAHSPTRPASLIPLDTPLDLDVTSTFTVVCMEWSIQQIARIAGTTSRTLRHYNELGLVLPSRIGSNGYRYYDETALVRLQRVLLLRELGLGLAHISEIFARNHDEVSALTTHLALLRQEQDRLARQIGAVEHTIRARTGKEHLMSETMFDGFDHTQHRDEVESRWGRQAYADADSWWRGMTQAEKQRWMARATELSADWTAAAGDPSITPHSPSAEHLAQRHIEWLRGVPGTPAAMPAGDLAGYVRGLADMYAVDERFAANYGGIDGASFVQATLHAYLDRHEIHDGSGTTP